MDKQWFDTWIAAMASDSITIDAVWGVGGAVVVSYGDEALVGATLDNAVAFMEAAA